MVAIKVFYKMHYFSKHSGQKLIFLFDHILFQQLKLILDIICSAFNDHIHFDTSVPFLYRSWLKSLLGFCYRSLKGVSARPNNILMYYTWRKILILQWVVFSVLAVASILGDSSYTRLFLTLVLQKHFSKSHFKTTANILIKSSTEKNKKLLAGC